MNKKVIYTATFPHKNNMDYFLFDPEVIPDGYDWVNSHVRGIFSFI